MDQEILRKITDRKVLVFALVILLFIAVGTVSYFYIQFAAPKNNPSAQTQTDVQTDVKNLVAMVGKLIVLPQGENPTIATVTDPERLRDQPFFLNAQKGDKVLIYTNAKKAILYSPLDNKIVEVAPVNIGPQPPPPPPPTSISTTPKRK